MKLEAWVVGQNIGSEKYQEKGNVW